MGREGAGLVSSSLREGKERKGRKAKRKTKERKEARKRVKAFASSAWHMDNPGHIYEVASNLGSISGALSSLVFVPLRNSTTKNTKEQVYFSHYFTTKGAMLVHLQIYK